MNVLSLFDGISCGQIALERAGIKVDNYFASEIDKHAIKVTQTNYPNTIQLGDISNVKYFNGKLYYKTEDMVICVFDGKIDLVIGGSPCQGFSIMGKQLAFDDPRSALYFEFERLLYEVNPKYFLLENVKMKQEHRDILSERLGVDPVLINSSLVSAQNRQRWYWTNILGIQQPEDKGIILQDILENNFDEKYYIKDGRLNWLKKFGEIKEKDGYIAFNPNKAKCLTVRAEPSWNTTYILQWPHGANNGWISGETHSLTKSCWEHKNLLLDKGVVRKLTPIECERLQTVPDNYTSIVSDSQRYKALGNGWTVDIVAHIFKGINNC